MPAKERVNLLLSRYTGHYLTRGAPGDHAALRERVREVERMLARTREQVVGARRRADRAQQRAERAELRVEALQQRLDEARGQAAELRREFSKGQRLGPLLLIDENEPAETEPAVDQT